MNFRSRFRHGRSIRRPRFPIRVQNFGDLATFSVDFCILYAECLPHFYLRFVWPTARESISYALTPTSIILTKFEVDMTIHCRVIAFCLLLRHVTLWPFDFEQLWYMAGHVTNFAPSFKTLRLSVLELWVITFPVGYHWKCVYGYCACAESRDPWVKVK